jgi:hypothetical protein
MTEMELMTLEMMNLEDGGETSMVMRVTIAIELSVE